MPMSNSERKLGFAMLKLTKGQIFVNYSLRAMQ
jgi:hypothetical protein